jgi:hypothetical protein
MAKFCSGGPRTMGWLVSGVGGKGAQANSNKQADAKQTRVSQKR